MRLHYPALLRENIRRGRMYPPRRTAHPIIRSHTNFKKYNIKENLK